MSAFIDVPVSKARAQLTDIINQVSIHGRTVYLTNYGRRVAVVVPIVHAGRPELPEGSWGIQGPDSVSD